METSKKQEIDMKANKNLPSSGAKFIIFSLIGLLAFFAPISIDGTTTIPIDVIVTWIMETFPSLTLTYTLLVIFAGAVYPFITKSWNESKFEAAFTALKILGLIAAIYIYFDIAPAWLMTPNMGPFLFNDLVVFISIVVPVGSFFLPFLLEYGLLEYLGVLFQRIMRPIWKVPGRSIVIALVSRAASLTLVYVMADKEFREGKYSIKEAVTIATGFIAVEATFMVVIAKTVDIMHLFFLYFLVTAFVTLLVTMITVRIWPINKMSNQYYEGKGFSEEIIKGNYFSRAWGKSLKKAENVVPLRKNIWEYLKDAMVITMSVLPAVLSIGLIALVLVEYTSLFDYLAYIFYPLTWALQIPEAFDAARAIILGVIEIVLPALVIGEAPLVTKFIIAVVSVSGIIFFSTTIPTILSTKIPINVPMLLVIWVERVILSLIIVTPIAFLIL